jgi:hypothetical protein
LYNLNSTSAETVCIFWPCFHIVSVIDVPIDVPNELPLDIEPSTMLPVLSLQVVDDPENAKAENPLNHHRNLIFPSAMRK